MSNDDIAIEVILTGILIRKGKVLVVRESAPPQWWGLPGGNAEPGERAAEAVKRVFREQLNMSVRCDSLLAIRDRGDQIVFVFKVAGADGEEPRPARIAIMEAKWVDQRFLESDQVVSDFAAETLTMWFGRALSSWNVGDLVDRGGRPSHVFAARGAGLRRWRASGNLGNSGVLSDRWWTNRKSAVEIHLSCGNTCCNNLSASMFQARVADGVFCVGMDLNVNLRRRDKETDTYLDARGLADGAISELKWLQVDDSRVIEGFAYALSRSQVDDPDKWRLTTFLEGEHTFTVGPEYPKEDASQSLTLRVLSACPDDRAS